MGSSHRSGGGAWGSGMAMGKLVIALCRKPFNMDDDELMLSDEAKKDDQQLEEDPAGAKQLLTESSIINNSGTIEYTRNNIGQFYHVEEVLALIDIANEGGKASTNQTNSVNQGMVGSAGMGMVDQQMHHSQSDNSIFHNELMQINHISQLFVGLNVFSVLFF